MKEIPKWLKILWVLCIPIGIAVAVCVHFLVDEAPEQGLALAAAQASSAVQAVFGENLQVTHNRTGSSGVEFRPGGKRVGRHRFDVGGSKGKGTILVRWQSRGKGQDFQVAAIERCVRGEKNETIWEHE
jgi:hypothetical protein